MPDGIQRLSRREKEFIHNHPKAAGIMVTIMGIATLILVGAYLCFAGYVTWTLIWGVG